MLEPGPRSGDGRSGHCALGVRGPTEIPRHLGKLRLQENMYSTRLAYH